MSDLLRADKPSIPLKPQHATIVNVAINNSDFVLVFAVIEPHFSNEGLTPQVSLESVATVSLSPIAAKQLLRGLSLAIQNFEISTKSTIPQMGELSSSDASSKEV